MLKPGWIIGIVMAFVLLTIISGVCELVAPLSATAVSRIEVLMNPSFADMMSWLGNLWSMFWFDYPFLSGSYVLVRYIFFLPVSVGMSVIIAYAIAQLLATAISSVGRLIFR